MFLALEWHLISLVVKLMNSYLKNFCFNNILSCKYVTVGLLIDPMLEPIICLLQKCVGYCFFLFY
jgi:hypothetical protein